MTRVTTEYLPEDWSIEESGGHDYDSRAYLRYQGTRVALISTIPEPVVREYFTRFKQAVDDVLKDYTALKEAAKLAIRQKFLEDAEKHRATQRYAANEAMEVYLRGKKAQY